jgi:hypothetical protein
MTLSPHLRRIVHESKACLASEPPPANDALENLLGELTNLGLKKATKNELRALIVRTIVRSVE